MSVIIFSFTFGVFQLYDKISTRPCVTHRLPPSHAVTRYRDAIDALRETTPDFRDGVDVQELRDILLSNSHLKVGPKPRPPFV